jgi:hypothetical protein
MDDLKKFQSDLDMLMVHTRRKMAMLDGMSRFLHWMVGHARQEDQMMGHFILAEHQAPRSPFLTAYPDQGVDAGFEPEQVEEAPPPPPEPRRFDPPPPPPTEEEVKQNMQNLRNEMLRRRGD